MNNTKIYYFTKYHAHTTADEILEKSNANTILCFDLEDGITDVMCPKNNHDKKNKCRNVLINLLNLPEIKNDEIKIGVRINVEIVAEFEKDLAFLKCISPVSKLFLPKINTATQLQIILSHFMKSNIHCEECIPVIESRKAINNLHQILEQNPGIKTIAFGHCDYNLSIDAFPFFHQDTLEYWKWVEEIVNITNKHSVTFINSPFLTLEPDEYVSFGLIHLRNITKNNFGQITISRKHSDFVRQFSYETHLKNNPAKNRLELVFPEKLAQSTISVYEQAKSEVFALAKTETSFLSPHEYLAAKSAIANKKEKRIYFSFLGGCFPVQHNIIFENVFHQQLKKQIENCYDINFEISILRYSRLANCLSKIRQHAAKNTVDCIVFHIRPEPFLRMCKLYYKYLNYENKLKRSLNIPLLRLMNPEKYDMMFLASRYQNTLRTKTKISKFLINANYLLGSLFGNLFFAKKQYLNTTIAIQQFCNSENIPLLVLGPGIRSETEQEKILSIKLNSYFKRKCKKHQIDFIEGYTSPENMLSYIDESGVFVTQKYHEEISMKLFNTLQDKFSKFFNPHRFKLK